MLGDNTAHDNGNIFYCDDGWVSIGRKGWVAFDKDGKKLGGRGKDDEDNFGTFLKAVRSRKNSDLTADVMEANYTSVLCHAANVAMRAGQRLVIDPKTQLFTGEGAAEAYLERYTAKDDNGRNVQRQRQIHYGVLFTLDEGRVLTDLGSRSGSTISHRAT